MLACFVRLGKGMTDGINVHSIDVCTTLCTRMVFTPSCCTHGRSRAHLDASARRPMNVEGLPNRISAEASVESEHQTSWYATPLI